MADFSVGNAPRPADYAGPIMNLGQQIAQLPGQYYAGKQAEAEMRLRSAFPNGIPRDARGQIDVAAAMDIFAREGGGQSVAPLMQMLMYSQAGTDAAGIGAGIESGAPSFTGPGAAAPGGPQVAGGPAPGLGPAPAPTPALPPAQQPSPLANDGAPTLRTTIAETAGANNDASKVIGEVARALRINPDKPLTPEEVAAAQPVIKQKLAAASTATSTDAGRGPPFAPMIPRDGSKPVEANRPPSGPVSGPTPAGPSQAGPPGQPGAPVPPGAPAPGAVPPPSGPGGPVPGQTAVQPPQVPQRIAQAPPPNAPPGPPIGARTTHVGTALEGIVPEGMTAGQFIDGNNRAAGHFIEQATKLGKLNPNGAQALTKRAEMYEARNKPVFDALQKAGEDTPAMKEAISSLGPGGTPLMSKLTEEQQKDQITRFGKRYESVVKAGEQAEEQLPQIVVSQGLVNSPDFNSGIGQNVTDTVKRIGALFGDPNMATPNQLFDKIRSGSLLNQIRAMAGTGPVRVAEMKMIDTMIADRSNAPASLRTLLEIEKRLAERVVAIRDMATEYKGGQLDPGYDKAVAKYKADTPLFSPEEVQNHKLIAPPIIRSPQEVATSGLQSGDPFKTPDGRLKFVP